MTLSWSPKDPDEILDYDIDWSDRLGDDTISNSSWTLVSGTVVIGTTQISDTATKVWLSGGMLGETCYIENLITTAGGRTYDQTVKLRIRAK